MLHEQLTWLTKEMETVRQEAAWMRTELRTARTEAQQARAEAQQAQATALRQQNGPAGHDEIKAADPPYFAGAHKELEGWIVACRLGIASRPSKFTKEDRKVIWAASFLDGPPRAWAQPLINAYLANPTQPPPELASFDALAEALRALFGDPNLERNAIAALNVIRQSTSVAEYRARFVSHSQHTKMDGNALAPYFYRGLKGEIKDLLAGQEEWTTFQELQDRASRLDARLQARKVEREREAKFRSVPPPLKMETKPDFTSKPTFIPAVRGASSTAPRFLPASSPPSAQGGPTPMELDSQRRASPQDEHERCLRSGLCFTCKEQGHLSRDCPKRKVRIMEIEMELGEGPGKDGAQE